MSVCSAVSGPHLVCCLGEEYHGGETPSLSYHIGESGIHITNDAEIDHLVKKKVVSVNFPHLRNLTTFPSYTVFGTSESANIVDTLKNIFFFLIKDTGPMLRLFCGH